MLIDLKPEGFAADWARAAVAIDRAMQMIELVGPDGFGVFDGKWLPTFGLLPVLAALREEIESKRLGDDARAGLRRWYWSNVFLERYSSAVESKSRKDYLEMRAFWSDPANRPAVFAEAEARIGAPGYGVRHSASTASGIYCGVFCLLAIRGARDWRRAESIQLQELQDHHIFPKAYLRRHGIDKRIDVNSVVNRTLISDETNLKIRDKAPGTYIADPAVFPRGATIDLLAPHFVDDAAVQAMRSAIEGPREGAAAAYAQFRHARESMLVAEIRAVCGVAAPAISAPIDDAADDEVDAATD